VHLQRLGQLLEVERVLVAPEERLAHDVDAALDVAQALGGQEAVGPDAERVDVDDEHDGVPEPDEGEDLLVEEVDGQHALDRVAVAHFRVAHFADAEVAHADLGEDARARVPAFAYGQVAN